MLTTCVINLSYSFTGVLDPCCKMSPVNSEPLLPLRAQVQTFSDLKRLTNFTGFSLSKFTYQISKCLRAESNLSRLSDDGGSVRYGMGNISFEMGTKSFFYMTLNVADQSMVLLQTRIHCDPPYTNI